MQTFGLQLVLQLMLSICLYVTQHSCSIDAILNSRAQCMYEDMQASRRTWQTCISAAMEAGYHIMLTVMAQHSVRFVRPTVLCCAVLAVLCCAVLCSAVLC